MNIIVLPKRISLYIDIKVFKYMNINSTNACNIATQNIQNATTIN